MFDIKSFYEASSVEDAVRALSADPDSEVISGGTDVLIGCGRERMRARAWYPSTIFRN